MPLKFIGDKQWLQWGYGMDVNNRSEIPAARVSTGTVPAGSMWTRNPIPACGGLEDKISLGAFNTACGEPQFDAPVPGVFGFGGGACGSSLPGTKCKPAQFEKQSFNFGIVDKVMVPDVEGEYVLGFRWESEQTPQVWTSCADVTISKTETPTTPFTDYVGCEACCGNMTLGAVCGNCTKCLNDKSGLCGYCWNPLKGYNPVAPPLYCLGFDEADGGPTKFHPGDDIPGMSPGCTRCWNNKLCPHQGGRGY
jgi:hypothetical protein